MKINLRFGAIRRAFRWHLKKLFKLLHMLFSSLLISAHNVRSFGQLFVRLCWKHSLEPFIFVALILLRAYSIVIHFECIIYVLIRRVAFGCTLP